MRMKTPQARIDRLAATAARCKLAQIEKLLRDARRDWDEAWEEFRASGYRRELIPICNADALLRVVDLLDKENQPEMAAEARAIVELEDRARDAAAAGVSDLARQAAKPGGAAGRINRLPDPGPAGFAERSLPPGDR